MFMKVLQSMTLLLMKKVSNTTFKDKKLDVSKIEINNKENRALTFLNIGETLYIISESEDHKVREVYKYNIIN